LVFGEISLWNPHHFRQTFESSLDSNKRQVSPNGCPIFACVGQGATCTSNIPCITCQLTYSACFFANLGNITAQCLCTLQEIKCFNSYPQCYSYSSLAITTCGANFAFSTGNCTAQCSALSTATLIPANFNECQIGSGLYCNVNSQCTSEQTSGACIYYGDSTCGNPNPASFISTQTQYSCQLSGNQYQCLPIITTGVGSQSANDGCSTSADCVSALPCTNGVCVGIAVGGTCLSSGACVYGAYCGTNRLCTPVVGSGGACNITVQNMGILQCAVGFLCGLGNVCVAQLSKSSGTACVNTAECAPGLFCGSTGTCVVAPSISCNTNVDCQPNYGSCMCNLDGTKSCSIGPLSVSFPAQCAQYYQPYTTCIENNQCKGVGINSCGLNKCSFQYGCYVKCIEQAAAQIEKLPTNCFSPALLAGLCGDASTSVISIWILMFAVLLHF